MTPAIKICGITRTIDAEAAVAAGAAYLGLIFAEQGPRRITLSQAQEISRAVRGKVQLVGVFQNQSADYVQQIASVLQLDYVQLHGSENLEFCRSISYPIIKAFPLGRGFDYSEIELFTNTVAAVLLDKPKGLHDKFWLHNAIALAKNYPANWPPFMFAGGLNAINVKTVIRHLVPLAVDVASAVESEPGVKDNRKIQEFCLSVRKEAISCAR